MPVSTAALSALVAASLGIAIAGSLTSSGSTPARSAVAPVEIREWTVPWERTRPRDPFVDGKGRVWFVGQAGNYIAYLDPAANDFMRFEIDSGTHPHNLIVAKDGAVWYAGNRNGMIGKLNPETGAVTRYPMPPEVRDPHTLIFDEAGDIWFTAQQSGYVGRLSTKSGKVDALEVPTANARPYGIVVDRKGTVWFNEFGVNKLASIDPETLKITEYPQPHERTRGRRIAATSDGMIWYVDYTRGMLGRFDPATRQFEEWTNPGGVNSMPYAMGSDAKDRIWFVEAGVKPNRLIGFDPETKEFFSQTSFGPESNTVRHMYYHAPENEFWFGTDAGTIARAALPD
jgi:virginiamycin B lyase